MPDGIFIDVAGSSHLFKGEAALLKDLLARLDKSQIRAKAAIADTPGCAWAVARYGKADIVPAGRASDAIGSLPVAALRLGEPLIESLRDVGIERIAQLASKPRASLQTRFGSDVLLRLDQALGAVAEVLTPLMPPEVPRAVLKFVEPVGDPEDLKRITETICGKLMSDLEVRGVGARRLDLVFMRVDNVAQGIRIGTSRPNRDAKHLSKLLSERLVLVDPGFGIEEATLTASWVEAMTERQTACVHIDGAEEVDISALVDTLRIRLGPDRVFKLAPVESDIPERSVKRVAAAGRQVRVLACRFAASDAAPLPARTRAGSCGNTGRAACVLRLAQSPAPRREGRRAGTYPWRVVDDRQGSRHAARLLPRRGCRAATASGYSAMRRQMRAANGGFTVLVKHEIRRATGHKPFLVPARSVKRRRAFRCGSVAWHRCARDRGS